MTEIIESVDQLLPLEGQLLPADYSVKLFTSIEDLTSYINAFKIQSGEFLHGTINGEVKYQLSFRNSL